MIFRAALLLLALGGGAAAQEMVRAPGAVLRGLDKVAGTTVDIELAAGDSTAFGLISITLHECRYPAEDPSSNAFARVTISDRDAAKPAFSSWMIADSPALSALDHRRYDVWVIRCKID